MNQLEKEETTPQGSVQKVACPSCSEVFQVMIPETAEEKIITVCPFCDQAFYIKMSQSQSSITKVPEQELETKKRTSADVQAVQFPPTFQSPVVAGLRTGVFSFLKRVPLVVIPVLGVLYLVTLGVYHVGKNGAKAYITNNDGSPSGALELGIMLGLLFSTLLVFFIYLIFSLLTFEVFFGVYEFSIFLFIYCAMTFFSVIGALSAAKEVKF